MVACRMSEIFHQHIPVLLTEAVENLITNHEGVYVDATFGRGSHSQAILNQLSANARLIIIDKDPTAIAFATELFRSDSRVSIIHGSYANLGKYLADLDLTGKVDGILFDLGVSSPQLDDPNRGFSFSRDGKLDMRMDTSQGVTASEWLATIDETELANALWMFGEEKFSRRIARAIVSYREQKPITHTLQLAEIITNAMPSTSYKKFMMSKNPATRSFQAIRIVINQELTDLPIALEDALAALTIGGHLAVISFHSLEDRIVKQFIKLHEKGIEAPRDLPIKYETILAKVKSLKPIKPTNREINLNPRARSAILRIGVKQS